MYFQRTPFNNIFNNLLSDRFLNKSESFLNIFLECSFLVFRARKRKYSFSRIG